MKIGYILLDGCADRPIASLNYTTPLQSAYTPNLDKIASSSRLGRAISVRRGVAPESDIAVFNMLGYSFNDDYPGRGIVEAIGAGIEFRNGYLALRANFASVSGRRIIDRRAGRDITDEEAKELESIVNSIRLDDGDLLFKSTVSYRGVLVLRSDKQLSSKITNTDPAYRRIGGFGAARKVRGIELIERCKPITDDEGSRLSAKLVNEFTDKVMKALSESEINEKRIKEGRLPVNAILLRDAGSTLPKLEQFKDRYGFEGIAIVDMPVEIGIAKLIGMKLLVLERERDFRDRAGIFLSNLEDGKLVYLHIKGPDEYGHEGDAIGKKKSIENIDREFFSEINRNIEGTRIIISCDHATPCNMKMHSSDPVPLSINFGKNGDKMRFTEQSSRIGSLGITYGRDIIRRAMSL